MSWDESEDVRCTHGVFTMTFTYSGDPIPAGEPGWQPHFGRLTRWAGGCAICSDVCEKYARARAPRDMGWPARGSSD
jgi:hypothetical protein